MRHVSLPCGESDSHSRDKVLPCRGLGSERHYESPPDSYYRHHRRDCPRFDPLRLKAVLRKPAVCRNRLRRRPQRLLQNRSRPQTPETLSAAENLKSLVVCGRVTVLASMYWGQAGLAYAGNPATSGQHQQDDVIQFLMSEPNADGEVRVKVLPHDGRAVGKANDQVWISWETVSDNRLDLFAFRCASLQAYLSQGDNRVPEVRPHAAQCMVAMPNLERLVAGQGLHDRHQPSAESRPVLTSGYALVVPALKLVGALQSGA